MVNAFHHTERIAADLIERRLGVSVEAIARYEHGIVNAVYFASLGDGRECVLRVSRSADRDYAALELWAFERCLAAGVAVPAVLLSDLEPSDFPEPFIITQRVAGRPGDSADLTLHELYAAYEDLGQQLARLHALKLPGFGELRREGAGFVGPVASWWVRLQDELAGYERVLSRNDRAARALAKLREVQQRLDTHRALFDLDAASLVHGDLQGKNFLVRGGKVAAILDFECAEAGDPVMDLRVFRYWDSKREALTNAILRGYRAAGGDTGTDDAFRTKLSLYELLYALLRLKDFYEDEDHARIADAFRRIERIERDLE